jgi:cytochrome P450 family 89 subfamily A
VFWRFEFKLERFLKDETFDITGSKEIKMMSFGVRRRICPGNKLALLHLKYFVANLVWNFDQKVKMGMLICRKKKNSLW